MATIGPFGRRFGARSILKLVQPMARPEKAIGALLAALPRSSACGLVRDFRAVNSFHLVQARARGKEGIHAHIHEMTLIDALDVLIAAIAQLITALPRPSQAAQFRMRARAPNGNPARWRLDVSQKSDGRLYCRRRRKRSEGILAILCCGITFSSALAISVG